MKIEPRVVTLSNGSSMTLPLGLTYDMGRVALCTNCGGVVTEDQPLIRRAKYRNRIFEQDFPSQNGFCIKCTQGVMTHVLARWFSAAETAIKTFNDLEQKTDKDETTESMLDVYEQSIEAIQIFIDQLGSLVGQADAHNVEYVHEPVNPETLCDPIPNDEDSNQG